MLDQRLKRRLRQVLKGTDKLNIGCQSDVVKGWLNIDLFPEEVVPGGLVMKNDDRALLLNFDMREKLPVLENNIRYVYASHFIEHLTFEEALLFLKRCYQMMKKKGVIRVSFPDLELWIKKYYENDTRFFDRYKRIFLSYQKVQTKGEIFMSQVHGFDHKWGYDFESMKDLMERAGFSRVTKKRAFDSLIPEIERLEPRNPGRLLESAYAEARK